MSTDGLTHAEVVDLYDTSVRKRNDDIIMFNQQVDSYNEQLLRIVANTNAVITQCRNQVIWSVTLSVMAVIISILATAVAYNVIK